MRVIKLCHGAGNGVDSACLMTASNMLIGQGDQGDDNSCVCPVLRMFIMMTNDSMPECFLGEVYGPLAWEILGTRTGSVDIESARGTALLQWAKSKVSQCRECMARLTNCANATPLIQAQCAATAIKNHFYGLSDWQSCAEIIREVASIGDKRPVECVLTEDQLADALT